MLRACLVELEKSVLEDVPVPTSGEGEVCIVVAICGPDIRAYHGQHPFISCPVVLGHEFRVQRDDRRPMRCAQ